MRHTIFHLLIGLLAFSGLTYKASATDIHEYIHTDSVEYEAILDRIDSTGIVGISVKDTLQKMAEYYEYEAYLFSKAIKCHLYLINIGEATSDYRLLIHSYSSLGRLEIEKARYDLSYEYSQKALELSDRHHDDSDRADIYNNLGKVAYYCADYENARKYYKMIQELPDNDRNNYYKALAINNSTVFEQDLGKISSMMQEAISLCSGELYDDIKCMFILNLCVQYINHGQLDSAKKYLETVRDYDKSVENSLSYYRNLGIINLEDKNYRESKTNLEKAYEYSMMGEFELKRINILSILYWVYACLGDYENAYGALATYMDLENNIPKNKILLELFNSQKENSISQEKNKQRIILIVSIFFVILLGLTLYAFYMTKIQKLRSRNMALENEKIRKEKEEQEAILKYQIKEQNIKRQNDILTIKRLQQYQDEVLIDDIIGKLKELNNKMGSKRLGSHIFTIIRELETSKDKSHWEEVETFLTETNTEFFENLLKDFPDLTVNERRLCAFLHMNMTSKEISLVTRKSVNSITTARSRLRTKLNIKGDDQSLVAFLDKYANKG